MPYRIRYDLNVDYVVPGIGLGMGAVVEAGIPGGGQGSKLTFYFTNTVDPGSNTFTNADVANLLTAMYNDLLAQLEVTAVQQKIQNAGTFSAIPPPLGN